MQNDEFFNLRDVAGWPDNTMRLEGGAPPAAAGPDAAGVPDTIQRALPDPFVDNLGIEYWIWNGTRLVPAWPDEVERIRAGEHLRAERASQALEERVVWRGRWRRVLTSLGASATRVRRFFAHWLGIPSALLPPEPRRHRKRPLRPGE